MANNLIDELLELSDPKTDQKIIKSFKLKDNLCPEVFEGTEESYKLNKEIRNKLIDISDEFVDFWGVDFFIHDIILTGSLANYNWSEYSDVDLHILIDFDEIDTNKELIKEFFDAKKTLWNEKYNVKIKNFDIELYVQDVNDEFFSSGVYSVLNNQWINTPEKDMTKIDDQKILNKGDQYAKMINDLVTKSKTENVLPKVDKLKKKLKSFRKSGLESGGEFSYENLTFKLLRRNGYIGKLMTLKNNIIDKKLSITQ
jgi:hypothetical protein